MRKKGLKKGTKIVLRFVQHLAVTVTAVSLLIVITGSNVMLTGFRGTENYNLYSLDKNKSYEDSVLFNTLLGKSAVEIVRFGTIRGQLETDGVFNPKKVIDVTAYNSREKTLPSEYVTACYYLGDLLKWMEYGFDSEPVQMDYEEQSAFLGRMTKTTYIDPKIYKETGGRYVEEWKPDYTFTNDVSSNSIISPDQLEPDAPDTVSRPILKEKFQTVDGQRLGEIVSTWDEYDELVSQVQNAAESLYYNYQEYQAYQDYFAYNNSNVRYCIRKTEGSKEKRVSNFNLKKMSENELDDYIKNLGKYIVFSPADLKYETNSAVEENTFRTMIKKYNYAYPDNVKVWIAVDPGLKAPDIFKQGASRYMNYYPYFYELIVAAVLGALIYLTLLVYLTVKEGRSAKRDAEPPILRGFDTIKTEGLILLTGLLGLTAFLSAEFAYEFFFTGMGLPNYDMLYMTETRIAFGVVVFLFDVLLMALYYSFIRRCKGKNLWSDSLTCGIVKRIREVVIRTYDNGSVVLRVWIPVILLIVVNAFLFMVGDFGPIAAVVLDLAVGMVLYREAVVRKNILNGIKKITDGDFSYQLDTSGFHGDNLALGEAVNSIGSGINRAVETSMKDERMKADLITNVSHDIKTPLTSIINYVDLMKREEIEDEKINGYIAILDEKSQRLKQLTDDLVEASKISSGNIVLHLERINLVELMNQSIGEFAEKFEEKGLQIVETNRAECPYIFADSRRTWRVIENLFINIYKYALENTRVYVDICNTGKGEAKQVVIILKNISAVSLNCDPAELTERFIRGDESRTTEGSGLGLSIAKNLTEIQNGRFELTLDGDLFKVELTFPVYTDAVGSRVVTVEAQAEEVQTEEAE